MADNSIICHIWTATLPAISPHQSSCQIVSPLSVSPHHTNWFKFLLRFWFSFYRLIISPHHFIILTGYGARRSLLAPLGDWTQSCQPMLSISSLPPLSCRAVSTTRHSRLVYLGLFYSCLRYLLRSPISHCFFLCLLYFLWCLPYRRRATTSDDERRRTLTYTHTRYWCDVYAVSLSAVFT